MGAHTRLTLGLRVELEVLQLLNDFSDGIFLYGTIDRPTIESPQSIFVVKGCLFATSASSLVEFVDGKSKLFVQD